jgi:hypothetical protein
MRSKRIITKNRHEPQSVAAAEATLKELQAQLERHTGRATELEAARKQRHAEWGSTVIPHVRFGSKADISLRRCDVRFTPESGHYRATVGCPLCAKSRHW